MPACGSQLRWFLVSSLSLPLPVLLSKSLDSGLENNSSNRSSYISPGWCAGNKGTVKMDVGFPRHASRWSRLKYKYFYIQ